MDKSFLKREWILLLAILVPFIYIILIWNKIPEIITTHYNIEGKPDATGGKTFGTLMLPVMNVFIYLVLLFIPRIDPRYKNYSQFKNAYYGIRLAVHLFLAILSIAIVQTAITGSMFSVRLIPIFAFLMLSVIGYFLPKVQSNFFVGIRTPWTLSSDEVWKKSHELGGKVFLYGGIITCLLLLIVPMEYSLWIIFPALLILILTPVIYSYIEFRKIQRKT